MTQPAATQTRIPFLDLAAMHDEVADALDAVWRDVVGSSAFIGGEHVERFEREWAAHLGRRHAVGVANGTDALELALRALGISAGAEVVLPANTFIATAEAIVAVGAKPIFVDVRPDTLLADAAGVEAALTSRTEAIIAVHLFGQPVDMDALMSVARRHGLPVVEDAAQAHGARWGERRAGAFGDVACFSFYPGKNLGAMGDGGAVVTDDAALAERVRSLGNHGRAAGSGQVHHIVGRNSRLDELQAAVLSAKLPRLDAWVDGRRAAAARYREVLASSPVEAVAEAPGAESSHHLFVVRAGNRDDLRSALAAQGIATGIHYQIPCHLQPAYSVYGHERLPVAEQAAAEIVSLPMFPHLVDEQVDRVGAALADLATAPEVLHAR